MDYIQLKWRVGEKLRRTIYAVVPDLEYDEHPLLGLMDTPELAAEVVFSHNKEAVAAINKKSDQMTFGEKELLIKDLQRTADAWKENGNLEGSIIIAAGSGGGIRSKRVYDAVGKSVNILGQDSDVTAVVKHAINLIRSQ